MGSAEITCKREVRGVDVWRWRDQCSSGKLPLYAMCARSQVQ